MLFSCLRRCLALGAVLLAGVHAFAAETRAELVTATRALDRLLQWGHYVVPNWHVRADRVAYWDRFSRPAVTPKVGYDPSSWWVDPRKDAALREKHRSEGLDFSHTVTFNLDEYYPILKSAVQSYDLFMRSHLFNHIDIDPKNIHIPNGEIPKDQIKEYCTSYEQEIEKAGGLDLQILGIGSNGHIGFNEPGSPRDSRTRLITLDRVTRMDAASDFFGERHVPRRAVTMGVGTILDARRVVLLAFGGASGLHAVAVADELGIERVVFPVNAATLSAFGILHSDLKHDLVRSRVLAAERGVANQVNPAIGVARIVRGADQLEPGHHQRHLMRRNRMVQQRRPNGSDTAMRDVRVAIRGGAVFVDKPVGFVEKCGAVHHILQSQSLLRQRCWRLRTQLLMIM